MIELLQRNRREESKAMARLEQIASHTYTITTRWVCMPLYEIAPRTVVLMDSGYHDESGELLEVLERNDLQVAAVLTSHAHLDHVGAHTILRERYGARLYADLVSAGLLSSMDALQALFPGYSDGELRILFSYMEFGIDEMLEPDKGSVEIGGHTFGLTRLPGHAFSHIGFTTEDGIFYVADLMISGEELRNSHLTYCTDVEKSIRTIRRIRRSDVGRVVLAHKGCVEDKEMLCDLNIAKLEGQLERTRRMADSWISFDELCRRVAEREYRKLPVFLTLSRIVRANVACLVDRGAMEKRVENNVVVYKGI